MINTLLKMINTVLRYIQQMHHSEMRGKDKKRIEEPRFCKKRIFISYVMVLVLSQGKMNQMGKI